LTAFFMFGTFQDYLLSVTFSLLCHFLSCFNNSKCNLFLLLLSERWWVLFCW
jgi:hypothetical protein